MRRGTGHALRASRSPVDLVVSGVLSACLSLRAGSLNGVMAAIAVDARVACAIGDLWIVGERFRRGSHADWCGRVAARRPTKRGRLVRRPLHGLAQIWHDALAGEDWS